MKTPTWGKVIGILMLFFGGCSVNSSLQSIYAPNFSEVPKQIFKGVSDSLQKAANDLKKNETLILDSLNTGSDTIIADLPAVGQDMVLKNVGDAMDKIFYMSEFTKTWMVRFGYMGILVSFIYILGGVFLLVRKSFSLKLAYAALILSIVFLITQSIVLSSDSEGSFIAIVTGLSKIFGIIADIVLLVVILASDKSAYKPFNDIDHQVGQI